jgi:hypothetical protein
MMVEFANGQLPWRKIKDKEQVTSVIRQSVSQTDGDIADRLTDRLTDGKKGKKNASQIHEKEKMRLSGNSIDHKRKGTRSCTAQ